MFTEECSKKSIHFLNVINNIENGALKADIFVKPIEMHQALL